MNRPDLLTNLNPSSSNLISFHSYNNLILKF